MLNKKTVDDINVKGKRVLVRCDFNVPLIDGKITDENRLVAALPTIKKLIADGGKVILCSHLGKPKGEPKPELSLAPVAVRLSELLGQEVKFAADPEVVGPNAKAAVEAMKDGDVILLENTRFVLKGSNIHTDLFQTAQRYDTQFSVFLFFQILKHLHFNYVFPPFLYDSDRTSLTSGHKKNSSFVNCPLKKELCLFPPAFSA